MKILIAEITVARSGRTDQGIGFMNRRGGAEAIIDSILDKMSFRDLGWQIKFYRGGGRSIVSKSVDKSRGLIIDSERGGGDSRGAEIIIER